MMTGRQALELAAGYIGSGPQTFYNYYSSHVSAFHSGNWCACFASCILMMADAKCAGFPGVYCPTMRDAGVAAGAAVSIANAKAGDIAYFNWDTKTRADHVGIVESVDANARTITSIDGNVSNQVGRRVRKWGEVMTVLRPTYAKEDDVYGFAQVKNGSSGNTVKLCQAALNIRNAAGLLVDGACGPVTVNAIKAWQKKVGLYQDGICGAKTWPTLLGK